MLSRALRSSLVLGIRQFSSPEVAVTPSLGAREASRQNACRLAQTMAAARSRSISRLLKTAEGGRSECKCRRLRDSVMPPELKRRVRCLSRRGAARVLEGRSLVFRRDERAEK
jgi:hypothetical protein